MIRSTALVLLLSSWSLSVHAESATASESRDADALTKSAISAYERQDYAAALVLLKRASVFAPGPMVGLYVARAHAGLGRLVEAAADYRGVVDSVEAREQNPARLSVVAAARDELAQLRPRIPSVELTLGESERRSRNLRLVMDGALVQPGAPTQLNPGEHEIVASDVDGEKTRLAFEIGEGESKTLGLNWRSDAARASRDPLAGGSSSTRRTLGVVALGIGATGLGIGTVTGVAAVTRYSAGEQHCPAGRCTEGPNVPENSSAFVALRTISAAGFVLGAAGVGTWLGLLLTTPPPRANMDHPKVSPLTPVVGMGSAGARYTF